MVQISGGRSRRRLREDIERGLFSAAAVVVVLSCLGVVRAKSHFRALAASEHYAVCEGDFSGE